MNIKKNLTENNKRSENMDSKNLFEFEEWRASAGVLAHRSYNNL